MPDRSGPIQRIYGEFPPGQPKRGRCRTVRWPAHRKPAWTTPFRGDLAMSALDCFDYAVSSNGSFSVVGSAGIGRPNSASSAASAVPSDRCGVEDLWLPFDPGSKARVGLDLRPGWVKRWSASWRVAGEEVVNPVGAVGGVRAGPALRLASQAAAPPGAAIHRLDRPAPRVRVPGRTAAAAGVGLRRRGAGGLAAVPAAVCDLRRVAGPYAGLCGGAG